MRASGAPRARPFADARGVCTAFTQPIALHLACESHAGCMKRAIALAVAEENASLVVSTTAEHARIGPDHCRGVFWVPGRPRWLGWATVWAGRRWSSLAI